MITPDEIRKKAERRYREVQKTWLVEGDTDSLFPMPIRFRHVKASDDLQAATEAVRQLRDRSKGEIGSGYSITWREIDSRTLGRNQFPDQIAFESIGDYLACTARASSFQSFTTATAKIRAAFPELEPWLRREIKRLSDIADSGIADGLLAVCRYLRDHPRCGLFARELPVPVDTKFVERHATKILRPWLDLILPPATIRADEDHFERRFGLGYPEPMIRMRLLDEELQRKLGFDHAELALPLSAARRSITLSDVSPRPTVFVVENLVNALTFPPQKNALVLAGLGNFVNLFRYLDWLHHCDRLYYWGDIDIQGYQILSQFRRWLPKVESVLMDPATLEQFPQHWVEGAPTRAAPPANLTAAESKLANRCQGESLRLEQEKIPQAWVTEKLGLIRSPE